MEDCCWWWWWWSVECVRLDSSCFLWRLSFAVIVSVLFFPQWTYLPRTAKDTARVYVCRIGPGSAHGSAVQFFLFLFSCVGGFVDMRIRRSLLFLFNFVGWFSFRCNSHVTTFDAKRAMPSSASTALSAHILFIDETSLPDSPLSPHQLPFPIPSPLCLYSPLLNPLIS